MRALKLPKLKLGFGKKEPERETVYEAEAPRIERRTVKPSSQYAVGRRVAFTIDEDSIQMAAARHIGKSLKLLAVDKAYFTHGTDDSDRQSQITAAIRSFVGRHGGRNPSVSLTLTGQQTALRTVTLPKLSGDELISAVHFEAKKKVPFPIEDCWLDHRITETITEGKEQRLKLSVIASTKLAVNELMVPFDQLGLHIDYVYHTQDVISHLLAQLPNFDPEKQYTLINILRRRTEISYYRGSELEFFHISSLGSSFLANRSDPTVFEYFAESLATEIQNSLDYYSGQFSSSGTQDILVYGDLCYTDDLISLLSDRFGYRFQRFPTDELSVAKGPALDFEHQLAVCLPSVAAAVNQSRLANLLPDAEKQNSIRRKADRLGIAVVTLLTVVLLGQWAFSGSTLSSAEERATELEQQVVQFQSTEMFATYNHLKWKLASNQKFISLASEEPSYLALSLREMSNLVPEEVRLYNLQYTSYFDERNVQLSGLITSDTDPPELALAELVENLTASAMFSDVVVEKHTKRREKEHFVLDFSLTYRGVM